MDNMDKRMENEKPPLYEHSKNSDYVHSPVAHAFYHTWKQLDERRH